MRFCYLSCLVQMKTSEGKMVSYCMQWIYYNESADHVKYLGLNIDSS